MNQTFFTCPDEPEIAPAVTNVDSREARLTFSRVGVALTVLTAVSMLVVDGMVQAILAISPDTLGAWWVTWVASLLPLYLVALPCAYLILRGLPIVPHNTHYVDNYNVTREKPRFGLGHWMTLLVIGMGCMYLGNFVGTAIMQILSDIMDYDYANVLNETVKHSPLWMTFLGTCIFAPLGEELIFRKLILDRTRAYGDLPSILLSSLLFALFHGNLFQFFYAFLLGMILAYVYTRSGRYGWCVAMHAAFNFLGSIALPELASLLPTDPEAVLTTEQVLLSLLLSAWVYGLIIAAVVLVCTLWHTRKLSKGTLQISGGQTFARMLSSPGVIACVAIMLLVLVVNLIPLRV